MKRLAVLPLALSMAFAAQAATNTKYLIISENGKQIGEQAVERQDDGLTKVRFIYKDNGRGPELTEQFRMGADGVMTEYSVKGNSTFGAVVDEHFARKDGQAEWKSTSEQGSKAVSGPAGYLPLNSSFEVVSTYIGALAAAPEHKLALLPSGTLSQTVLDTAEVSSGSGAKQTVQLVAQTGVGMSPGFYWATTGASPRLFGVIIPGFANMLEEGWQGAAPELAVRQKKAESRMLEELAAKLQHPLTGLTLVRNARVFDSDKATVGAPSDIYVLRGRITAVLPAGSPVREADNTIDAAGRIVLPGLFDMHGHVDRWSGALNMSTGVTSVRDMGNDNKQLQAMLDETAAGKLLAPQVVPAGFLEGESPFSANNGFVIKDLAGAKDAIDWYAERGYPQLKIYNSFPKAILKDTVAYAHSRGMRVSGHIPAGLRAQEALDAGYDEIQHINQVLLNFLVKPDTETRNLNRFLLPAEKVADMDFNTKPFKDFVAGLVKKQISIDPTMSAFAFIQQKDGDLNEPYRAFAANMPPDVARSLAVGAMKIDGDATLKRYRKSYAKMVEFVGIMYKAGVPIVAGTDDIAGFTLHSELALLVKAGLTPAQALQVATRNGARYTRTSNDRGSIAAGKLADLVLVDGDPTRDIADVRKVAAVITRGYVIYPREIDSALGIAPFVQDAPQVVRTAPAVAEINGAGNEGALRRIDASARQRD
ncbi:amidohydrolase [Duganella sp. BJB488]|uniref:amidohydrolase family protein n=1 Tax=unclassified Duganella TaxID=2636909 RepID=UPI000E34DFF4|nr:MULTISPECIES: amidohydrolase family protein [unclassified Duganella]RFP24659.1 amidohydrolase [Duganella sp. BJB489]RFP27019.1 amidohydrolase [Duganella sp. BJB488]RFP34894.1 amidohydrolase [Duganella sp. BJB480]